MKEGWMKDDEWRMMNEGWWMKDDEWRMMMDEWRMMKDDDCKLLRGFGYGLTDIGECRVAFATENYLVG